MIIVTMDLSRTISEIHGDFNIFRPCIPPADEVSIEIWYRHRGQKNQNDRLREGPKSFKIGLAV